MAEALVTNEHPKTSLCGIYHIIMQGINRQVIFHENEDYNCLREIKREGLSVRQLARLTGINRGVIQKA